MSNPPCWSGATWSWLSGNMSKDENSTASLGILCQCSVTLTMKGFLLMFGRNRLVFSLWPLPLVLSLSTSGKSLAVSSLLPLFRDSYRFDERFLLEPSLLQSHNVSSYGRCSSHLIIFVASGWTLSSSSASVLYWGKVFQM